MVQTEVQDLWLSYDGTRIHQFDATVSPGIDMWFEDPTRDLKANHALLTAGGPRFQILFTAGSMIDGVNCAVMSSLAMLGDQVESKQGQA